jgi:hypothetical protein
MTADEWDAGRSPHELLRAVRGRVSPRKLRLFACACCRPLVGRVSPAAGGHQVTAAEQFADGRLTEAEFLSRFPRRDRGGPGGRLVGIARFAFDALGWPPAEQPNWDLDEVTHELVPRAWEPGEYAEHFTNRACLHAAHARTLLVLGYDGTEPAPAAFGATMEAVAAQCAGLLRDVLGNPFRPAGFDPGWRTDTAVSLAAGMYDGRDFGAMPILADALQDAGCEDEQVLTHCRGPHQVHVRGCWVVDLVLGRE